MIPLLFKIYAPIRVYFNLCKIVQLKTFYKLYIKQQFKEIYDVSII